MAYLHSIGSAVPGTSYRQEEILEVMKAWHAGDERLGRLLSRIYRASGVEKRHSVVSDFLPGDQGGFFFDPSEGRTLLPGTAERNRVYAREATPLAARAAGSALRRSSGLEPADVTHLVTVSCTGFFAPGPDVELVDALGLDPGVARFHVGFMGCYGVFPALRTARALCAEDPDAVVLVVSVELCTLHLQASRDSDSLLAASVFADGAAAAVVRSSRPQGPGLRLDAFTTSLSRRHAGEMAWTIGDSGFEMVLSAGLAGVVESEVAPALAPLLADNGIEAKDVGAWAVHPGGRAILDRVEGALCLTEGALAESRAVLAEYGNMSSATVLFVLERLLYGGAPSDSGGKIPEPSSPSIAAAAFGPGLTIEGAILTRTG